MSEATERITVFGALKPQDLFWDVLGNPWMKVEDRDIEIPDSEGRLRKVNATALIKPAEDGPTSLGVEPGGWGDFFPQAVVYTSKPNSGRSRWTNPK